MESPRLLIDASIVIEHLRKQNRQGSILFRVADRHALYTSSVVEFELYAGAVDDQKRRDIEEILRWCSILPFSSEVARVAAAIYRDLRTSIQLIEIRDIFIASTAIAYDIPLITLNTGHFGRIAQVRLEPLPD